MSKVCLSSKGDFFLSKGIIIFSKVSFFLGKEFPLFFLMCIVFFCKFVFAIGFMLFFFFFANVFFCYIFL